MIFISVDTLELNFMDLKDPSSGYKYCIHCLFYVYLVENQIETKTQEIRYEWAQGCWDQVRKEFFIKKY